MLFYCLADPHFLDFMQYFGKFYHMLASPSEGLAAPFYEDPGSAPVDQ